MSLTIERPETEARLIRFATSRGLTPLDALDELLSEAEEDASEEPVEDLDEGSNLHLSTIPDILMYPEPDAIKRALEDMDAGKGIPGADFLAELRRPVEEIPAS